MFLPLLLAIISILSLPLVHQDQQRQSETSDEEASKAIKVDTTLVMVPAIASKNDGTYITDLKQEEFTITEDKVKQNIAFFATVKEPFQVVLMLDTSGSTQEKLSQIKRAAVAFVKELQPSDRVKVVSFDDELRDLIDFTNDRAALDAAIEQVQPGSGTKLYDAVQYVIGMLRRVQGRKAIVIFTDGVDYRSDDTRDRDNLQALEESGIIVYPIRYNTRADTERLVREQQQSGVPVDLGTILKIPNSRPTGTTPSTVPGGQPIPRGGSRGPVQFPIPQLPGPPIVIQPSDRRTGTGGRLPDNRPDNSRDSDPFPESSRTPRDSVDAMLDNLYKTADVYLNNLASTSGGKVYRVDTLVSLSGIFSQIAAELRTQYAIGYYPTNQERDGKFRKIQVQTSRKNVAIRTRPGYRARESKWDSD